MRVLHTADWHLGHTLRDHSRQPEHEHFLKWLVATVVERKVDALLIAGDVFDSANPPPAAWRLWFEFLGDLKRARPSLQVVVIAGNHDSAARLEAPRELLSAFDVRVVGQVRRDAAGALATGELVTELRDDAGQVEALCVAIPFLRGSDVMSLAGDDDSDGDEQADGADPWIEAMRRLHAEVFAAAEAQRRPGQALVAMGHGYFVGGQISELSERKVFGGNQHALPLDLFPPACTYVALGHLHRPQLLGGREHVRYSGSPIPLAMPEREHPHHVVFADLRGGALEKVWSLRVPRLVDLIRLPERGALEPEAALAAVAALPERDPQMRDDLRPLLEVAVRLPLPAPGLGEDIARLVQHKNVRLVRVEIELAGSAPNVPGEGPQADLATLAPEEIFVRRFHRDHEGDVPDELLAAFRSLLDDVEHRGS
ncbi:MAG: exonuclease SbcCD subunit D C-terminal domain-containing protein [Planctomycetes bacterium]|nr:exonuclease SbcCD subunit D C-terminal domain-containing protein [Planctomycetota bacterium]MCB9884149.1 exonuclease SbcCD subunit D C-terminal domain-containing protein [Planctomycetota bacterium]